MNVARVHRVIVLACYFNGHMYCNGPFRLRAQGMQLVLITRDVNIRSTFFARLAKVCVYSRVCWLSWLQTL